MRLLSVVLLASPALSLRVSTTRIVSPVMQMPEQVGPPQVAVDETVAGGVSPTIRSKVQPTRTRADQSVVVQGGTLKTWTYQNPNVEQVQVILTTEGRPLDANIELYNGPDNTPVKMQVYVEDGRLTPFSCVVETPRYPNTVAIRNTGQMVFPFTADVLAGVDVDQPSENCCLAASSPVQGGALRTYPFDPTVDSVEVLLTTDGRPLNARIELLQGPNNNKQVIDVYTEDGLDRPFFCILETPGSGTVVRVVNTGPMEFPIAACLVPNAIGDGACDDDDAGWNEPVIGGMGW